MPAQATKSEATVTRALDQRLRNIRDPQNIQDSQSTISNPLNATLKITEKTPPESHRIYPKEALALQDQNTI